ncbi:MAG: 4Fe-4S binding protein [Pseudomonadota bacterium]
MAKGMVIVDDDRCKGCGLCVDVCPVSILELTGVRFNTKGYHPVEVKDMDSCTGCAVCAVICPDIVFTVYREKRKPKEKAA